jgi:hypothetical protein
VSLLVGALARLGCTRIGSPGIFSMGEDHQGRAPTSGEVFGAVNRPGESGDVDDVELDTLEWVDWHNNLRLHTACHDLTPVEYEQVFYGQHPAQQTVGTSTP